MVLYIVSSISGCFFGLLELCRKHRRMKWDAIRNLWGVVYIIGMGLTACIVYCICGRSFLSTMGLDADPKSGHVILAMLSGPLGPFLLKKTGGKKGADEFVSYHEQIFSFLKDEINLNTRIKRYELADKVAKHFDGNIEHLACRAIAFIDHIGADTQDKEQQKKYIGSCCQEKEALPIALFLIEAYGANWVKRNLMT